MLDRIIIEGYKSLRSVDVQLLPVNVLIGPNGAGKSNFIDVFRFLNAVREGRLSLAVAQAGGAERLLHFGSKTTKRMRFELSFEDKQNGYDLELVAAVGGSLVPSKEHVSFWDSSQYQAPFNRAIKNRTDPREAGIADNANGGIAKYVRGYLSQWRVYHFHDTSVSSPLRTASAIDDNSFLRYDGSNLASFLYLLKKKYPKSLASIRDAVRLVAPYFDEFRLEPRELDPGQVKLEWNHSESSSYFDAYSLSDGTLRFLALATVLLQPSLFRPPIILVDEPELGLHPSALTLLASLAKSVTRSGLSQGEGAQVILSTQSATLLDSFEPEDVLVADREQGGSSIRRLDAAALGEWLEDYSLGQLWQKNELGGRPVRG